MRERDDQQSKPSQPDEFDVNGSNLQSMTQERNDGMNAFVGKGVHFKGVITYNGSVRIDGILDGEIHTDGVLLVGEEAIITAKVTAGTLICQGKITGDILVKEKIKLRAPAIVSGSVITPKLSMEEGVLFDGTLEMAQGVRKEQRETTLLHAVNSQEPSRIEAGAMR